MAKTAKRLFGPALLTNAAATKITVSAGSKLIIRHVHFENGSASSATIFASIGADAAGTRLFDGYPLAANTPYDWYGYIVMDAAEILQAYSGTNNVITMTVFGDELTLG